MNTEFCTHGPVHHLGESATHPIELRYGTPVSLLRQGTEALAFARHKQSSGLFESGLSLAGKSPQRRHALLTHRIAAHSGVSNCEV